MISTFNEEEEKKVGDPGVRGLLMRNREMKHETLYKAFTYLHVPMLTLQD